MKIVSIDKYFAKQKKGQKASLKMKKTHWDENVKNLVTLYLKPLCIMHNKSSYNS